MRTRVTVVVVVLAVAVAVAGLAAQLGAFQAQETRTIPLDAVYVTFIQDGIKSLDNAVDTEERAQISSEVQGGPQRLVLCVGNDVVAAVKSAGAGFAAPDEPVPAITTTTSDIVWLAAYMGSDGSMPPAYRVQAVEVTGKTLRVTYERDEAQGRSCDLRTYLVWAPVGCLEAGLYTLELVDAMGKVTASRPWQVTLK